MHNYRLDLLSMKLDSSLGSGSMKWILSGWSIGISVRDNSRKVYTKKFLKISILVYSVLGFGFASGGVMIIIEIIFAKLTKINNQRSGSSLGIGTILLLLTLSATLAAVTIWMIYTFYDPFIITCALVNELCEWE